MHCTKILCHLVIGLAFDRSENTIRNASSFSQALLHSYAMCNVHVPYSVSDFFLHSISICFSILNASLMHHLLPFNMTLFMFRFAFYLPISPYSASINTYSVRAAHAARATQRYNIAAIKNLHRCCVCLRWTPLAADTEHFYASLVHVFVHNSTYSRNINAQQYTLVHIYLVLPFVCRSNFMARQINF